MMKQQQASQIALVRAIWEEVFHLDHLDEDANCFALGGDSLKATRILSHVGIATGKTISMRMLFDAPTLKQFVHILEDGQSLPPYIPIRSQRGLRLDHFSASYLWLWYVMTTRER